MKDELFTKFQQVGQLLKEAEKIFITAHENPDPDAVGSVLGIYHALRRQDKEAFCFLPGFLPPELNFLPGFSKVKRSIDGAGSDFDLFFCLDYGDFGRLRLPQNNIGEEKIITIDHHLESDQRGQVRIIEPELSSTSEIIYLWLKDPNLSPSPGISGGNSRGIDKEIATCLLTGIVSDTGGFSHISTSSQTLRVVSDLILTGAPLARIIQRVSRPDLQTVSKIWGKVLSRIENDKQTSLVYSWLSRNDLEEYQGRPVNFAQISSLLSTITEANLSLFLVEREKGKIEGSLRSEPFKGRNVALIAKALGGGGHPYAAGFRQEGTIDSVLKKVLELLK